jgi:hypothetical protein
MATGRGYLMRTSLSVLATVGLLALAGVTACSEPLDVDNDNSPDRDRVLANPADVEQLVGSLYQQINDATLGDIEGVNTGMITASFMSASGLANNGLGPRSGLPRGQIDNGRGNPYEPENFADYRIHSQVARAASDALARVAAGGFLLDDVAQTNRMIAFAHFVRGVAVGNLALVYDSTGVPRPTDAPADIPPLEGYSAVMVEAIKALDSAMLYSGMDDVPAIPAAWLNQAAAMDVADFEKLVRSYRARFRAGVARSLAENAGVDWALVRADAAAGIDDDFEVLMDPANGWEVQWLDIQLHFRDVNWHQMPYYYLGMADTSGLYGPWLNTPRDTRAAFLIKTPDKRFPSGETRAAQTAKAVDGVDLPAGVYFRNRDPGDDQSLTGWQASFYDHYRFFDFADAGGTGAFPVMTETEIDMLEAEAAIYIATPASIAEAAVLIDKTRVPNGLAPLTGVITSATQTIPGGNACVPRVPAAATGSATVCGTILDAMKWEKRMETAFTSYGAWFFDARRWGELPVGTAYHWPVPFQELDARRLPIYNTGDQNTGSAAPSIYGFGSGTR